MAIERVRNLKPELHTVRSRLTGAGLSEAAIANIAAIHPRAYYQLMLLTDRLGEIKAAEQTNLQAHLMEIINNSKETIGLLHRVPRLRQMGFSIYDIALLTRIVHSAEYDRDAWKIYYGLDHFLQLCERMKIPAASIGDELRLFLAEYKNAPGRLTAGGTILLGLLSLGRIKDQIGRSLRDFARESRRLAEVNELAVNRHRPFKVDLSNAPVDECWPDPELFVNRPSSGAKPIAPRKINGVTIIGADYAALGSKEMRDQLIARAVKKELALFVEGIRRNHRAERQTAEAVTKKKENGFLYGLDDDFVSGLRDVGTTYLMLFNDLPEAQFGKIYFTHLLSDNSFMRRLWVELLGELPDAASRRLFGELNSVLHLIRDLPVTEAAPLIVDRVPHFAGRQDWLNLLAVLLVKMKGRREITGVRLAVYEKFLSDPANEAVQNDLTVMLRDWQIAMMRKIVDTPNLPDGLERIVFVQQETEKRIK